MLKSTALGLGAFLYFTTAMAQTGPGGVGNTSNNGLWLRTDALNLTDGDVVASWDDISGNGNTAHQDTASQRPVYHSTSALNGMPVVRLDGVDDRLLVDDTDILDNTTGITYFAVIRPSNIGSQPKGILGKRITFTTDVEYAYTWFFWDQGRLNLDVHTQNNRRATAISFANDQNYLLSWDFDGSRPVESRSTMYKDDSYKVAFQENSTALPNSNQVLTIGALNNNYRGYLEADYAEIIHYNYALNDLERLMVNNYLAGKYGLPLTTTDVYIQDDPGQGDYDFDIAGIGRMDATTKITHARGSGVLTIKNPDDLDADEYLLWGHDGGDLSFSRTTDLPPVTEALLDRTWRISETNLSHVPVSVGAVDLEVELPGFDNQDAGKLALVIDTNNDGYFDDETPITGVTHAGGDRYTLSGVTGHVDGSRMTMALLSYDASMVLPVDLVHFEAFTHEQHVRLEWEAQNETSFLGYGVERSTDGTYWQGIAFLPAHNTGVEGNQYYFEDVQARPGHKYYRLELVERDGSSQYSEVRYVSIGAAVRLRLYPNPVEETFTVERKAIGEMRLVLFDQMGRDVTSFVTITAHTDRLRVNLNGLPSGVYLLQSGSERCRVVKR